MADHRKIFYGPLILQLKLVYTYHIGSSCFFGNLSIRTPMSNVIWSRYLQGLFDFVVLFAWQRVDWPPDGQVKQGEKKQRGKPCQKKKETC